jgi:hypothetical protein
MKLYAPFVQLPLQFDAGVLAAEVAALPADAWQPHESLPDARVLPLVSVNGELDDDVARGPMRPTAHLAHCPYVQNVLGGFDAPWGRVCFVGFGTHPGIARDADVSCYGMDHLRLHVPVITHSEARFMGSGAEIRMEAGECWVVDTWREHTVTIERSGRRIHLVAETVGGSKFRDLFGNARVQGLGQTLDWRPQVLPRANSTPRLRFESATLSEVMTPWELRERIGFILGDTRPHPRLTTVRDTLLRFIGTWHVLWTRYGLDADGRGAYREALEEVAQRMGLEAPELQLENEVGFLHALRNIVLANALSGRAAGQGGQSHP